MEASARRMSHRLGVVMYSLLLAKICCFRRQLKAVDSLLTAGYIERSGHWPQPVCQRMQSNEWAQ